MIWSIFVTLLVNSVFCQLRFSDQTSNSRSRSRPSNLGFSSSSNNLNDFTHTVNSKFFNNNRCCRNAAQFCKRPCNGRPCEAGCRVQCGFLGQLCDPVSCSVANPGQCTGGSGGGGGGSTSSCDPGYTLVGSKCLKLVTSSSNYLQAILGCVSMGSTLVSIQSQAEQDAVFALTGSTGGWIGFTDFLNEGTFAWVDESVVSYTNWRSGQPNNGNNNQHCTQIRPDGDWDDVICDKNQQYVCQKNARP